MLTRRDLLKAGLLLGGALLIPGARRASTSPGLTPFVDALPVMPALAPRTTVVPGAHFYEIRMQEFTQKLHRDLPPTTVWGYEGLFPGPTIEAQRDVPVFVRWVNELRDTSGALRTTHYLPVDPHPHGPNTQGATPRTVVHLHGGKVPPESDGYPEATILPGQRVVYYYPNAQRAATRWYHDHALGITRLNVYMGLAGFYLIRDPAAEGPLNLPSGEFDVPLCIQDRAFNPDGSLQYPAGYTFGFFGDTVLVNGKVWPYLAVKRGKYRFRFLNGSNTRTYQLELSSGATMYQIGTEAGLLGAPVPMTQIQLSPAERADVVIDFEGHNPGDQITLLNTLPGPPEFAVPNVMQFQVGSQTGHLAALPGTLTTVEFLSELAAVQVRDITLDLIPDPDLGIRFVIKSGLNSIDWDDVTFFPRLGTIEVWRIINMMGGPHPIHLHMVNFQVLDRQSIMGGAMVPPPANEVGWKDTVTAFPGQITRVITRFDGYTGRFSYHCHILEHEDHEMMRQFEVVP